ncbi:insulinase family protein [Blautia sp. RD014234]|nr:insulinase family protein [Blautia parvula]
MIHKYQEIQNCDIAKVRLLVRGGSQKEKKYENGITHLLEHMNLFLQKRSLLNYQCVELQILNAQCMKLHA